MLPLLVIAVGGAAGFVTQHNPDPEGFDGLHLLYCTTFGSGRGWLPDWLSEHRSEHVDAGKKELLKTIVVSLLVSSSCPFEI